MAVHDKGGSQVPYERYHLSEKARDDASRVSTLAWDGLMSGDLFAENQQVSAPSSSTDTGEPGQWAIDNDYIYYCLEADTWVRIRLTPVAEFGYLLTEDAHPYSFENDALWIAEPA
jgi:hypothetical protein